MVMLIDTHKLKPNLSASPLADIPTIIQLRCVGVELHLQKQIRIF